MSKKLANWSHEDGPPFNPEKDLTRTPLAPPQSTYRVLDENEANALYEQTRNFDFENNELLTLHFSSLPITSILVIDSLEVMELVTNMDGRVGLDEKFNEPILIYTSDPFSCTVEITIYPQGQELYMGRLLWEIAKVYEDIFINRWKEFGVVGHGLSDLVFEAIDFFEGKRKATLFLGS